MSPFRRRRDGDSPELVEARKARQMAEANLARARSNGSSVTALAWQFVGRLEDDAWSEQLEQAMRRDAR